MGLKNLPIGYSSLSEVIKGNCVYIDKTLFVKRLADQGKYYFLSRPRRFGKSLFLDTLHQAFAGQRELYEGLYLKDNWDWSTKHPVIRFGFSASSAHASEQALLEIVYQTMARCARDYAVDIDLTRQPGTVLTDLVHALYDQYGVGVVVLIDEYDKPILDVITDTVLAVSNREILKGLYSSLKELDSCLKFVFLTGVSKFSKVSLFSGLNNLYDLTLDAKFADICGYTQTELELAFQDQLEGVDKAQLKEWYNGYNFAGADKQKVYNPYDILLFFQNDQRYKNYWFETATPTFLIKLLQKNQYYMPNFESVSVTDTDLNSFDIETLPFIILAFQTGYLTIKRVYQRMGRLMYELSYPNFEVKCSLNEKVADMGITQEIRNHNANAIYAALDTLDFPKFKNAIQGLFASIPNDWYRNNRIDQYEGFYCSIVYSYFCALGYEVIGEDVTNKGKIDLTIKSEHTIFIFEFKVSNQSDIAAEAILQIKSKGYSEKYRADSKPIYIMGMAFDPDKRNLLGFEWEQVEC